MYPELSEWMRRHEGGVISGFPYVSWTFRMNAKTFKVSTTCVKQKMLTSPIHRPLRPCRHHIFVFLVPCHGSYHRCSKLSQCLIPHNIQNIPYKSPVRHFNAKFTPADQALLFFLRTCIDNELRVRNCTQYARRTRAMVSNGSHG